MVKSIAALLVVSGAPPALNASWTVCVNDPDSLLNTPIRAAMLWEFRSLMGGTGARLSFANCGASSTRIRLAVTREPPDQLAGVLGLAWRRSDRIEPRLQVFYGPLAQYLGQPNNASAIGRALARVAAHEASHFLEQQARHCESGLLRAAIPAYELAASNPRPFHRGRRCTPGETATPGEGLRAELGGRGSVSRNRQGLEPADEDPSIR